MAEIKIPTKLTLSTVLLLSCGVLSYATEQFTPFCAESNLLLSIFIICTTVVFLKATFDLKIPPNSKNPSQTNVSDKDPFAGVRMGRILMVSCLGWATVFLFCIEFCGNGGEFGPSNCATPIAQYVTIMLAFLSIFMTGREAYSFLQIGNNK